MADTNAKIKADIQRLDVGSEKITFFSIDTSLYGGVVYNFVSGTDSGVEIVFNGTTYYPVPIEISSVDTSGKDLPRPTMVMGNVGMTFVGVLLAYEDGVGCKVTRTQTLRKYLDGYADADTAAHLPIDIFYIEQKLTHNKFQIEWELVSPTDVGDQNIPREQAVNTCGHFYRVYKSGALDYTFATCEYTDSRYYTADGVATTVANDVCGKNLSDCRLRYPNNTDELPFKGFPGIGKIGRDY